MTHRTAKKYKAIYEDVGIKVKMRSPEKGKTAVYHLLLYGPMIGNRPLLLRNGKDCQEFEKGRGNQFSVNVNPDEY